MFNDVFQIKNINLNSQDSNTLYFSLLFFADNNVVAISFASLADTIYLIKENF